MFYRQDNISSVQMPGFKLRDTAVALAVVNIFETGVARPDHAALAVLNDGAGISYGFMQFTHRSGSLARVVESYLASPAEVSRAVFVSRLPQLQDTSPNAVRSMARDSVLKDALQAAGKTSEMCSAQITIAQEMYVRPAAAECRRYGFSSALALAVILDSMVHGSWERIRSRTGKMGPERAWVPLYVKTRHEWLKSVPRLRTTTYRTRFFLDQISHRNWLLDLPLSVHGTWLTEELVESYFVTPGIDALPDIPPGPDLNRRGETPAAPPDLSPKTDVTGVLDLIEGRVNEAAAAVDQTERIVTTVISRSEKIKAIRTTVIGAIGQAVWSIAGLIAGIPRPVWAAVAIASCAAMAFIVFRQLRRPRD